MHSHSSEESEFKNVVVLGLGYIGLPTAAMIASKGIQVLGVDINAFAVDKINRGEVHITEPDLEDIVKKVVKSGKLRASTRIEEADAFIIAVPTPFKGDHEPDLSYVVAATRSILPVLREGNLVILESTSPVGTTELILEIFKKERPDLRVIHLAYCPERVLPGKILRELIENDRVIGGISMACSHKAQSLYKVFVQGCCFLSNSRTSEMVKLAENSFRDVNIAFANELSIICDRQRIDPFELIELANRHPRVKILQPGPGVGGHCIAVDPWFIVNQNPNESKLIRTARLVNDSKPKHIIKKVFEAFQSTGSLKLACLGLAFKADIDDLRESPSVQIVREIAQLSTHMQCEIRVVEPHIQSLPKDLSEFNHVSLTSMKQALVESDIVLLLVNHREFLLADPNTLVGKHLIDTRGIWRNRVSSKGTSPKLEGFQEDFPQQVFL